MNIEEFKKIKEEEARKAAIAQQRADIDYIAMMTNIELGEDIQDEE